jgi:Tfp pilus assembly protein PilO
VATRKQAEAALAGNNLIIALIVVSFIVIALTALAGKTLWSRIALDQKVVTAKDEAASTLKQNVENAPLLVAAYSRLGELQRVVADALPNDKDSASILTTIENMGGQSGVTVRAVVPGAGTLPTATATATGATTGTSGTATVGAPAPQSTKFNVTVEGSFDSTVRFLKAVETSARPMKVTNMQISGNKTLSSQLEITTYFQEKTSKLPIVTETIK